MDEDKRYWFPAKRYGWGWGFPSTWEGWLVFAAFAAVLLADFYAFPPDARLDLFLIVALGDSVALCAICWLKGEPPRWRWGGR